MIILFPSFPFEVRRIDPGFEAEEKAALEAGFKTAHVDTEFGEGLAFHGLPELRLGDAQERVLYRGWIMKPERHAALETAVLKRGYSPITSQRWYLESYEFPQWYRALEGYTPVSMICPVGDLGAIAENVARAFGNQAVIVKDYLKSRKHEWWDACFIKPADDRDEVRRVVGNFVERQGEDLAGGLVFREFVEFKRAGTHPKSGMPIIQEWRLFVWQHQVLYAAPYWSVGTYDEPPKWGYGTRRISDAIEKLDSQFFVLDVAQRIDGTWEVVEVNDGGSAGIPEGGSAQDFYVALKKAKERAELRVALCYINDHRPVETLENDLTRERCLALVQEHLGIRPGDVRPFADYDLFINKGVVNLSKPDANGIVLALYNQDGKYSLRTYKPQKHA